MHDEPVWRPAPESFSTPEHEADYRAWLAVGRHVARSLERALETPCVATIDRVHELAEIDFRGPSNLISALKSHDSSEICRWLLEGTLGERRKGNALMIALTGKDRDGWFEYHRTLRASIVALLSKK